MLSCIQLFANPRTVASPSPLSMQFSRQEYWSRLPFPAPGDLPHPEIRSHLLHLLPWQADSLSLVPPGHILGVFFFLLFYFSNLLLVKDTPTPPMQYQIPPKKNFFKGAGLGMSWITLKLPNASAGVFLDVNWHQPSSFSLT